MAFEIYLSLYNVCGDIDIRLLFRWRATKQMAFELLLKKKFILYNCYVKNFILASLNNFICRIFTFFNCF